MGDNTEDPLDLCEFREVPDDQRAPSPVTPEPRSRPVTPETPEQQRRMMEGSHLLTTEMLQTLLAAHDRPPQTSYPKLQDPEPFEGEKAKFKTFLAQCELKFRTEGNRFDNDEKKTGYVSSLLRGVAWNWVETFLNQEGGINLTWEELKTNMRHAFGQVDAEEIALEKFRKIQQGHHQGKKSASGYTLRVGNVRTLRTQPGNVFAYWTTLVKVNATPNTRHTGVCLLDVDGPRIDLPDDACHGT